MEFDHQQHLIHKTIMKKLLGSILFISSFLCQAEDVKSTINNVTVYLEGAQIERTADINLPKGKHVLELHGITQNIDPNSIQVKSNTNLTLLSVRSEINYLTNQEIPKRIQSLEDSLQVLEVQIQNEKNAKFALELELDFLVTNKNIKGDETLTIEDFNEVADMYKTRVPKIKSQILITDLMIQKVQDEINKYQAELRKVQSKRSTPENVIYVEVSCASTAKGIMEVTYYTPSAYWSPKYDIRAKDVDQPIELTYKADVVQNTGNDWKNVNLVLSTSNPSLGGVAPTLNTWVLYYYDALQNRRNYKKANVQKAYEGSYSKAESNQIEEMELLDVSYSSIKSKILSNNNAQSVVNSTNINFNIPVKYDIESNQKPTSVEINKHEIAANFAYITIPKKQEIAYLRARMTNWSQYHLLPGESSIFFEGSYVGTSFIDPFITNDTLDVSLGQDKSIIVERKKNNAECKKSVFGLNKKESIVWDISVKNTKTSAVEIVVEDQIPLSNHKDIVVTLTNQGKAEYDEKTGKLTWRLQLAPGESFETTFGYEVKIPKNKSVVLE